MPPSIERLPWSRLEVEAVVADYFDMLAAELSGKRYSKAAHRRALIPQLNKRNDPAVEYKHCNISAVLIRLGFPYLAGYRPYDNYQELLFEVVAERLAAATQLHGLASQDADAPIPGPAAHELPLKVTEPPRTDIKPADRTEPAYLPNINYLEREARNRSLGLAGEEAVLAHERARLRLADRPQLADKIRHVSKEVGDFLGYDILSFEVSGQERLIEVKTTKRGIDAPFFVTRHEVRVSEERAQHYHLYRVFDYRATPRLFMLDGALSKNCALEALTFQAVACVARS